MSKYNDGIGKDIEKFVKITKEEHNTNPSSKADLIGEGESQMIHFKGKEIRQIFHDDEWFFAIVDVIEAIVETKRPRKYWSDLKHQLIEKEGFSQLSEKIGQLKMQI